MKRMLVVLLGVLFASFTLLSAQDVVAEEVEEVVEAVEEEVGGNMGHDLVLGLNGGAMIPFGQNIKDVFGMGIPVSLNAQIPKLVNIQDLCVYAGLNLGYFMAAADVGDDLSGIVVAPTAAWICQIYACQYEIGC